jgi:hypothetical protein
LPVGDGRGGSVEKSTRLRWKRSMASDNDAGPSLRRATMMTT